MKKLISLLLVFIALYAQAQETPDLNKAQELLHKNTNQVFIENKGQWPDEVLFMTKTNGIDAWITQTGVVYDFYQLIEKEKNNELALEKEQQTFKAKKGHIIKFNLLQCNKNIIPEGKDKQETYYNYFIGNDKSKWASFVGLYNEVIIKNIYNGIDIRYYFDNGSLRYDYIVTPGADPKQIQFNMEGADQISLNNAGEILIKTTIGETKQTGLYSYQNLQHKKQAIQSFFKKLSQQTFAIALGSYDHSKPLIIDPLVFCTYLGGSSSDNAYKVKHDALEYVYIAGSTSSTNFPTTTGAYRTTKSSADLDCFYSKMNKNLSSLVYSTFIGGSSADASLDFDLDSSSNIYLTGSTKSTGFPTTNGAYDTSYNGIQDAFVTKLNSTGSALIFSTYLGGTNDDMGYSIVIDTQRNVYLSGKNTSTNFPKTTGTYPSSYQTGYFVSKLNSSGSTLLLSTTLSSNGIVTSYIEQRAHLVIDDSCNVYIAGNGNISTNPPATGAYNLIGPGKHIFILKLNPTFSTPVYTTQIGGDINTYDQVNAITIDNLKNIYITGTTTCYSSVASDVSTYPITAGAFQTIPKSAKASVIITKFNASGNVVYSTFISSTDYDWGFDIEIDSNYNAIICGSSGVPAGIYPTDFPRTSDAFDSSHNGYYDAFLSILNPTGSSLIYSTYIGGSLDDRAYSLSIDASSIINIAGYSTSSNFPTTSGVYSQTKVPSSNHNAFIFRLNKCNFNLPVQPLNKSVFIGNNVQFSVSASSSSATFQWQENSGNGFINLSNAGAYTGTTSNILNINSVNFAKNNNLYRCLVTDSGCTTNSYQALLTVNCLLNITRQPTNQSINQGSNTQFSVSASSATGNYQWQQNTGTGFVNLVNNSAFSNVTDDTLVINAAPITLNNTTFRCIVTDNACSVTSNAVNLTVNCTLAVNRQPIPLSILVNSNNQFSVAANIPGATFQWQQSLGSGFINLNSNTIFSNVNDDTLIITNTPLSLNNTRYRCIINDGPCSKISDSVLLNVICPLAFTYQPVATNINIGNNGFFAAIANSSSASYQWQQDTGTGFSNLSNNATFSNVTDDTLLIANAPLSLNNTHYRCIITDGPCSKTSDSVLLNVVCTLAITSQPVSTSAIADSNAMLHLVATCSACNFQWQQNTGTGFVNLNNNDTFSNVNNDTLLINHTYYKLNNSIYRCIINDGPCSLISNNVILNINCNLSIIRQVTNSNTTIGNDALFSLRSSIATATFQWQQNNGLGFINITDGIEFTGVNDDTLIIKNTSLFQNNNNYRCLVTHGSCIDTSITGILSINCLFHITNQPVNQNINIGSNTQFIIQTDNNNCTYQWQQNTGTGFSNINNNNIFSGTNNDTLVVTGSSFLLNNTTYRCGIALNNCYTYSNPALLTINCVSSIILQPQNQLINQGDSTYFIVHSNNPVATFQWQINNGSGFINLNNNSIFNNVNNDSLTITNGTSNMDNTIFRCIINNNNCFDTSNSATLNVICPAIITLQPTNTSGLIGNSAYFSVASPLNAINFKWQVNDGSGFVSLKNDSIYSGVNQDTLKIKKIYPTLNNYQYRTIVNTNQCCCSDTSNNALLQVANISTKELSNTAFNIYPNPNNGQFKIDGLPNNATVTITNLLGETIRRQQTNNKEVTIDLNNVADGIYLVKVEADNYSMTRKITIAK